MHVNACMLLVIKNVQYMLCNAHIDLAYAYQFTDFFPDTAFLFNADPDPAFRFPAGPDPAPHQGDKNLRPLDQRPPF
jgi:hypothetical protein